MKTLIKIVLFLFSINTNACVVLLYHHFSDNTPASTSISPDLFAKHLQYIANNNLTVLTVKQLIYHLQNQKTLPDKCVVLTTDDAYKSIYDNAYPLLKQYNMQMTVFVATDGVDDKYPAFMTYKQMRETQDHISYYNHSADHAHFHTLSIAEAKNNIMAAQQRLNTELNTTDKFFAYPYGEYNTTIYNLIKNMGYVAFGQQSGAVNLQTDIYAIPRFPMNNNYGNMQDFITKINTIAMPILDKTIEQVANENPPTLRLDFAKKIDLNCFVNGELLQNINWDNNSVYITAKYALPKGRNKYTCTANSGIKNRYYWLSHQWIIE